MDSSTGLLLASILIEFKLEFRAKCVRRAAGVIDDSRGKNTIAELRKRSVSLFCLMYDDIYDDLMA